MAKIWEMLQTLQVLNLVYKGARNLSGCNIKRKFPCNPAYLTGRQILTRRRKFFQCAAKSTIHIYILIQLVFYYMNHRNKGDLQEQKS